MKQKIQKGSLVRVDWVDAEMSEAGWHDLSTHTFTDDIYIIRTFGLVIKHNKNFVTLSHTILPTDTDEQCGAMFKIPVAWIKNIKVIQKKPKKSYYKKRG